MCFQSFSDAVAPRRDDSGTQIRAHAAKPERRGIAGFSTATVFRRRGPAG